ncbi:putative amidotransferase [Salinivibrio phage CW02]|uniref:Putative amidotransferase n=1 Tax=Salinivibrio phage CW02 TaxID=1161935 RepID=H9D1C6_9CAUD|nr:glutamine amidotransferase [Salinivibrio phage CW02]AFE86168.1 putative amidotransferase [Salinivibrio phage CW02]
MKVLIVGGNPQYEGMFSERGWEVVDNLSDAKLVVFTGGADVSPLLYGHKKHPLTHSHISRDTKDTSTYERALDMGLPMAGICRGSQFLHTRNGGKLWQDVDGHVSVRGHYARNKSDGRIVLVTSTHHQMMMEGAGEVILEGYDTELTHKDANPQGKVIRTYKKGVEPEAVWHKGTACLCYQPHPEQTTKDSECQVLFFEYLNKYFGFEPEYKQET